MRLDELVAAYATFARGGEWLEPTWSSPRSTRPHAADRERRRSSRRGPRSGSPTSSPTPRRARIIFGRGGSLEFPFPVAVEDRHVAGVPRQLDGRLHARRHGRRLGRQLRSHAAARLDRRHRRGADLPRRDARRDQASARRRRCDARAIARGARRAGRAARSARSRGCPRTPGARRASASGCLPATSAAVQLAPPERRRAARRLAAGVSPVGARERPAQRTQHAAAPLRGGFHRAASRLPRAVVPSRSSTRRPAPPTSSIRRCAGSSRRLPLRVVAPTPGTIEWQVAGRVVGTSSIGDRPHVAADAGRHRITARDERGRVAESSVVVR